MEREKFRSGLKTRGTGLVGKRKRDEDDGGAVGGESQEVERIIEGDERARKKKKVKGPKGPNPLSVKKPKKTAVGDLEKKRRTEGRPAEAPGSTNAVETNAETSVPVDILDGPSVATQDRTAKRKRKRKHKPKQPEVLAAAIDNGGGGSE